MAVVGSDACVSLNQRVNRLSGNCKCEMYKYKEKYEGVSRDTVAPAAYRHVLSLFAHIACTEMR